MSMDNSTNNTGDTAVATPSGVGMSTDEKVAQRPADTTTTGEAAATEPRKTNDTLAAIDHGWKVPMFQQETYVPVTQDCLINCFCTPCAIAHTRRQFHNFDQNRCLIEGAVLSVLDVIVSGTGVGLVCTPFTSLATWWTRKEMREAQQTEPQHVEDAVVSVFCTQCTALQLHYEGAGIAAERPAPEGVEMTDGEEKKPIQADSSAPAVEQAVAQTDEADVVVVDAPVDAAPAEVTATVVDDVQA